MTSPTPEHVTLLAEVRVTVDNMKGSIAKLDRAVQGDPDAGTPSLRGAIKAVAEELQNETDSICERLDKIEQAGRTQEAYLRGMTTVIKWLGGGTLAGLIALIGMLSGLFGGGK